jgi:hypothetical protein
MKFTELIEKYYNEKFISIYSITYFSIVNYTKYHT